MALAERQRKSFGEDWAHVRQANGELKNKKLHAHFQGKIPCKLQENKLKPPDFPREN